MFEVTEEVWPVVIATEPGEGFTRGRWLARWGATTLLDHVLAEVRRWELGDGLVILGEDAETILASVDYSGFSVIIDPEWAEGTAASLRTGFDLLQRETDAAAALVINAAVPTVSRSVVDALLRAATESERPAVVPKYRYAAGEPVLLARWLWPQLVGVDRNASLANVLDAHPDWIEEVWIDQVPPVVVDSPDALARVAPRR